MYSTDYDMLNILYQLTSPKQCRLFDEMLVGLGSFWNLVNMFFRDGKIGRISRTVLFVLNYVVNNLFAFLPWDLNFGASRQFILVTEYYLIWVV